MSRHREIRAVNRHLILREHKKNISPVLVAEKVKFQSRLCCCAIAKKVY